MNKNINQLRRLLTALMLLATMAMPAVAWAESTITPSKPSGDGTEASPYLISTAAELYWFAGLVNGDASVCTGDVTQNTAACAKLTTDIVVNSGVLKADGSLADGSSNLTNWTPIGYYESNTDYVAYTGTFDGNGKTISGLYVKLIDCVGLFGYNCGTIKNVGVVDSYFDGNCYVGGVCGYNDNDANLSVGTATATITNCYNTGTVSGRNVVGGVCGYNCAYSSGGTATATITNCHNTGSVSGSEQVGGVCGYNCAYSSGGTATATITNCHNTGSVSGSEQVGGVCGVNSANSNGGTPTATITNCYYLSGCNADDTDFDNNADGTSKTTAQFKSGEVAYLLQQSSSVWGQAIGTDNYPVLGGAKVYENTPSCSSGKKAYSNTEYSENPNHNYINGICTECGAYQPAQQVSDTHHSDLKETHNGYYAIDNPGKLYWFAGLVNGTLTDGTQDKTAKAVLTTDIVVNSGVLKADGSLADDVSGFRSWTPIGYYNSNTDCAAYTGTFDGNGKTISGLYFNDTSSITGDFAGLFGYSSGTIKNVGVVDSYFNGNYYVGGVCGYNCGTITNCYNKGTVSGSGASVGGVCGYNDNGTITNCYNKATVSGSRAGVGGVCGHNDEGTVSNCYNTGDVTGTSVGGVCGFNDKGTITNCYNKATVKGDDYYVGGVCGYNDGNHFEGSGTVSNCYNTGAVSGSESSYVGNVCGVNASYCTISNCYFVDRTTETATGLCTVGTGEDAGTSTNVTSKTAAQFASGEVCYLLNGSRSEVTEENQNPIVWYQNLAAENGDASPVFTSTGSNTVYQVKLLCSGGYEMGKTYNNSNTDETSTEHIPSETATFNSEKKIYNKVCKGEGCGHLFGYYADAAATIVAKANEDETAFTVASYTLEDATAYDSQAEFTVTSLTYKRLFSHDKWLAVYVPFEIDCAKLGTEFEMAVINNFHEYEQ
ncbi:MAG: GLUG motif-containing protein, partial [Prevotella sp.]